MTAAMKPMVVDVIIYGMTPIAFIQKYAIQIYLISLLVAAL